MVSMEESKPLTPDSTVIGDKNPVRTVVVVVFLSAPMATAVVVFLTAPMATAETLEEISAEKLEEISEAALEEALEAAA